MLCTTGDSTAWKMPVPPPQAAELLGSLASLQKDRLLGHVEYQPGYGPSKRGHRLIVEKGKKTSPVYTHQSLNIFRLFG